MVVLVVTTTPTLAGDTLTPWGPQPFLPCIQAALARHPPEQLAYMSYTALPSTIRCCTADGTCSSAPGGSNAKLHTWGARASNPPAPPAAAAAAAAERPFLPPFAVSRSKAAATAAENAPMDAPPLLLPLLPAAATGAKSERLMRRWALASAVA